jgi:uncharacterized protein YwqG
MEEKFQELINNLPKELLAYKEKIEATKQIYIPIELEKAEDISLTTSKVGGYPYLPMDMEYPIGKDGVDLDFLAQINFAEMPPLQDYPTHGILQFYIDYEMDIDYDDALNSNIKVIYHETIEQSYQTQFPKLDEIRQDEAYLSPIDDNCEFKMIFCSPEYEVVGYNDFRFDEIDMEESAVDAYWDTSFSGNGHKIGGYAFFTQTDPRYYKENELGDYTHLLFQLDSDEEGVMWGDMGVGNFFIRPQDLRNRDFSKVLFNWDCY